MKFLEALKMAILITLVFQCMGCTSLFTPLKISCEKRKSFRQGKYIFHA